MRAYALLFAYYAVVGTILVGVIYALVAQTGRALDYELDKRMGTVVCQYEDGSYEFVDPDTPQPGCR